MSAPLIRPLRRSLQGRLQVATARPYQHALNMLFIHLSRNGSVASEALPPCLGKSNHESLVAALEKSLARAGKETAAAKETLAGVNSLGAPEKAGLLDAIAAASEDGLVGAETLGSETAGLQALRPPKLDTHDTFLAAAGESIDRGEGLVSDASGLEAFQPSASDTYNGLVAAAEESVARAKGLTIEAAIVADVRFAKLDAGEESRASAASLALKKERLAASFEDVRSAQLDTYESHARAQSLATEAEDLESHQPSTVMTTGIENADESELDFYKVQREKKRAVPLPSPRKVLEVRMPRSVSALYLKPLRREAHYGIPSCNLQLRSYALPSLEFFSDFSLRAAYYLRLPAFGPVPLPRIKERWTVPRGHFVHKKSQENFERITLRRLIQIRDGHPETVQIWLAFLRKHQHYGVGMKASIWEFNKLNVAKHMDESMDSIKNELKDKWAHMSTISTNESVEDIKETLIQERIRASGGR